MPLLQVSELNKRFDRPVVRDISLTLDQGRILCLLGPSGCGKTTLLRMIAGLEQPDSGEILINGEDISHTPVHQRQFGMMFQDFALFPHKNVFDNVSFGLQMLKQDTAAIEKRTLAMLELTGLTQLKRRNVAELSGGERQRVALARSLAPEPKLLMLDEPLGSLDRALRERLLVDIRNILKEVKTTAIFVTHDQTEAFSIADEIAVLNHGQLVQLATPETLYMQPASPFIAQFLGFNNLLKGTITRAGEIQTCCATFDLKTSIPPEGQFVLLRPESASLVQTADHCIEIRGALTERRFIGRHYRISLTIDQDQEMNFDLPNNASPPAVGAQLSLWIDPQMVSIIQQAD